MSWLIKTKSNGKSSDVHASPHLERIAQWKVHASVPPRPRHSCSIHLHQNNSGQTRQPRRRRPFVSALPPPRIVPGVSRVSTYNLRKCRHKRRKSNDWFGSTHPANSDFHTESRCRTIRPGPCLHGAVGGNEKTKSIQIVTMYVMDTFQRGRTLYLLRRFR